MKANESPDPWSYCTWEGAELHQLHHGAARSFRDNLIWLEEMTELAERLSKSPTLKESLHNTREITSENPFGITKPAKLK